MTFDSSNTSALPRARARYLAQAILLEEESSSSLVNGAIYFAFALLLAAIAWAAVTTVTEVTISRGEVVPAGLIHDIQHLEGGIVRDISVRDGERVERGELLLQFAPSVFGSEFEQAQSRRAALKLQAERLAAIIERRTPIFSGYDAQYTDLVDKQRTIFDAQISSNAQALSVLDAQIRQRESELHRQQNQTASMEKEISLLTEQVDMRSHFSANNVVPRTELLRTQTQLAEAVNKQRTAADGMLVAQTALEEAQQRRLEATQAFYKDVKLEAGEVAASLAEVEQSLIRLEDKVTRLNIYAPISGFIQGLSITRINAVVEPGQVIMQIVPQEGELVVESRVPPTEIGHVYPGQFADVKIDSYDPSRFGTVDGVVKQLSASTYLDEEQKPYYKAEVELKQTYVGNSAQQLRIIPGMTVQVDIKTGEKTILDYLLRPVSRGFDNAFQER